MGAMLVGCYCQFFLGFEELDLKASGQASYCATHFGIYYIIVSSVQTSSSSHNHAQLNESMSFQKLRDYNTIHYRRSDFAYSRVCLSSCCWCYVSPWTGCCYRHAVPRNHAPYHHCLARAHCKCVPISLACVRLCGTGTFPECH